MVWRPSLWAAALGSLPAFSNGFAYPDCKNGPLARNLVCNPRAPDAARAAALVAAMNITEKLSLLVEFVTLLFAVYKWADIP